MAYSGAFRMQREPGPEPDREQQTPRQEPTRSGIAGTLDALVKKLGSVSMETDDLIMALILYLMYRESGDKDLLIMLGAMLLA